MVGIDEVARRAEVSTATVSRALSGRGQVSAVTRARVEAAAKDLGYVVSAAASSLATGRTRNIGVLLPYLDRWFFNTVLSGAATALARDGYDVTLYALPPDPSARTAVFETALRRRRVDGIIVVSIELGEQEAEELNGLGIPVIAIGGRIPHLESLHVDDVTIARLATRHLLDLGHRRIAQIGGKPEFDLDFHLPDHRRQGWADALAEAGVTAEDALYEPEDFTIEGGHRAAIRLLERPVGERPTAVFAVSDEMAIGALLAARDLGLDVPGDVSVIGIDGHDLGAFFRLTTIDQFPHEQGERAAAAILSRLEPAAEAAASGGSAAGSGVPDSGDLPFRLVERSTTGPVPGA